MASFTEVIPPGQAGSVDAELDTKKLHGDVGRGITVYTNDPARPKVFLTIRAQVRGGVILIPHDELVLTNRDPAGLKRNFVVRRERSETGTLALDEVMVSAPWLDVTLTPVTKTSPRLANTPAAFAGDWVVTVAVGEAPYGRHSETLAFDTGLARQPRIEVPINAMILPPVNVSEDRIELSPDEAPTRTLLLTVRAGLDPAALEVESRPAALSANLERSGRRGYKLHVAWDSTEPPSGEITLSVGSEKIRLPVSMTGGPSGG